MVSINPKWLLFGAGGIGRALVAQIAQDSGHDIIIATSTPKKAKFLKSHSKYGVMLYAPVGNRVTKKEIEIKKAFDINNTASLNAVCSSPDLKIISTSVRVDNLESVAKVLAPALAKRKSKVIILTCENVERNGDKLRAMLEKEVPGVTKNLIIPNISVDCFVPPQESSSPVINREEFGELWIEKPKDQEAVAYLQKLLNVKLIDGLINNHYQKKIIGVSGLHSSIAWLGLEHGHQFVHQAARDPELQKTIDSLVSEFTEAIIEITGFSKKEVFNYVNTARIRIRNEHIPDPNERFFRNLRNKLIKDERFLKPALIIFQKGIYPEALLKIISIGFKKLIKDENLENPEKLVKEICQLPKGAEKLEKDLLALIS